MIRQYRANVFIKFSVDDSKMKEHGLDVEMPPAGFLHDDLIALVDGEDGVTVVESVVVKDCVPLPTSLEYEVVQTLCLGCNQLKETVSTSRGRFCNECNGTVIPIGQLPRK